MATRTFRRRVARCAVNMIAPDQGTTNRVSVEKASGIHSHLTDGHRIVDSLVPWRVAIALYGGWELNVLLVKLKRIIDTN